jgi:hypothetical protein
MDPGETFQPSREKEPAAHLLIPEPVPIFPLSLCDMWTPHVIIKLQPENSPETEPPSCRYSSLKSSVTPCLMRLPSAPIKPLILLSVSPLLPARTRCRAAQILARKPADAAASDRQFRRPWLTSCSLSPPNLPPPSRRTR